MVRHPKHAFTHLALLLRGTPDQERGHNSAGAWAVLGLILLVLIQSLSGLFITDEDNLIEGAFYGALSYDLSDRLLSLHHIIAELLMIVVGLHVFMVFFYAIRAGQNLITPMITGRMRWMSNATPPAVKFTSDVIGLVLLLGSIAFVGFMLGWL